MSALLNFGQALEELKKGAVLARRTWKDEVYIYLQVGTEASAPCLIKKAADGLLHMGWASNNINDILAEDWYVVI